MKELNLGLDIGTNSIGWALVDENGEIVKKNGFRFWGVRMFDEAQTAAERRTNRSSRRRLRRRRQRIEWLQEEFKNEIEKQDENFFQRLNDSFYKIEDKRLQNKYTFFDDNYTDKDYFEKYPTIYHLRKALLEKEERADIRELYLAIHHIIKYRGHFLNEGETFNPSDSEIVREIFENFNDELKEYANQYEDDEEYFQIIDIEKHNFYNTLQNIMLTKGSKSDRENQLRELMGVEKKTLANELLIKLLIYGKTNPKNFAFVKEENYQTSEIKLDDEEIQEKITENKKTIRELSRIFDYVDNIKLITDYYYLLDLLGVNDETKKCNESISNAMVNTYDKHQKDLKELKRVIKTYLPLAKYKECFKEYNDEKKANYSKYVGGVSSNGEIKRFGHCSKEKFEEYIKKLLAEIKDVEAQESVNRIIEKIDNGDFLPKQNSGQNTTIPMQLNLYELRIILNKQAKYHPFLLEKENGLTRIERIVSIFEYHIPYYVGPLSNANNNQFSWLERKPDPIRPWNFNEVINIDASATNFIKRMQNKCTYLQGPTDYCLPKMSLLFSEYNCLQYLNKLRIGGSLIDKNAKEKIFNDFFLVYQNPTKKKISEFIYTNFGVECNDIAEINCNMSSWITLKSIFKDEFNTKKEDGTIEAIIKDITLFEDKKILEKRFDELYHLSKEQTKALKGLNYKGYSSLCKKLLDELVCVNHITGEVSPTIIEIMRDTNLNLQEILYSKDYPFIDAIDEYNKKINNVEVDFRTFIDENLYVSPIMKRSLIQTYRLIEEIERIFGRKINKYYIECARTNKAAKKETNSRYKNLNELYKSCNSIQNQLLKENIELKYLKKQLEENKNKLSIDALYLYFTQLGKCMYTLNNIDIEDVIKGEKYDIDHIYPQSLIKDDSISNRVLVDNVKNQSVKGNKFLYQTGLITARNKAFYKMLLEKKLITKEKYRRLTEVNVDATVLDGFVNRQLVSTNQSVKGVIQLLKKYKNVKNSDIIFSKAENISDFRNEYDMLKSRTANNFHHAHDAYLNVVIGRAINTYYEKNRILGINDVYKIQDEAKTLNPLKILKCRKIYDLSGKLVWDLKENISKIEKYLYHVFDIHETLRTYTSSEMFSKVSILPAPKGTVMIKSSDDKMNIDKYGGITSYKYCRYAIVEAIDKKGKAEYILEAIPTAFENKIGQYLKSILTKKYKEFKIINDNIPVNVIVKNNKLKFYITGKTGTQYLVKNAYDRFFSKDAIRIIRSIDKYNDLLKKKVEIVSIDNTIIVSPSKKLKNGQKTKEIVITVDDCVSLIEEIKKVYSKDIYAYAPIISLTAKLNEISDYSSYKTEDLVKMISEILILLKTNERGTADLSTINLAKNYGTFYLNKKLSSGMKLMAESITGYFEQEIFEVPRGI